MDINDKIMDQLISETLTRKSLEDDIEKSVMKTLVHRHRHAKVRRWARIVAFAFGAPMALVAFLLAMRWTVENVEAAKIVIPVMVLSVATVVALFTKIVENFSPSDM